jgi:benzoate-CoA ligase family protein
MFILGDCGARLVIAEDDLEWKIDLTDRNLSEQCSLLVIDTAGRHYLEPKDDVQARPALPTTTRDTPAFLLYTSGSTGKPKGALHVHGSIPYTIDTYARSVLGLSEDDRVYSASRLFFAYGLGNSLSFPLSAGAAVILDASRPTGDNVVRIVEEQRPSVFFGVPSIYRSLLDIHARRRIDGGGVDFSSVRLCVSAGEALPATIFEEWRREFDLETLDGIGSTEMLHIFISNCSGKARPGSSGTLVEGYKAQLRDDSNNEVAQGELGNLWISGSSATRGYWNRPDLTEQTINSGWVRTGDLYRRDEGGFYYHVGRADDCFKVKGLWVSPVDVEAVLLSHRAVREAAVVRSTDENGLATVKAYIVIRTGGDQDSVMKEVGELTRSRLPGHKVPAQIEFINELPRTSTGKVQRYKLRTDSPARGPGESDD